MLFPTLKFAVFFSLVLPIAWALARYNTARKCFLVFVSYVFYGFWDWRFCFLLAFSSLANYAAGRFVEASEGDRRRLGVGAAVVVNLSVLGFFKYWNFFVAEFDQLMYLLGVQHQTPALDIVLPVAISFFTFHGISYVVDVYRRRVPTARSLVDLLLYISFFPQLVAGPIVRASTFMPQLERRADPASVPLARAVLLIVFGLFKKVVVANALATQLVDPVFMTPAAYGTWDIAAAVWGYAVQIYCDFSAYTDIATGTALLLGYEFPKNFDQPYRARSMGDFWHRWHISLSTWLREYLYIPLGGNRGGVVKTCRNMMITMFLGGLWHGAGMTFIVWGVLHGSALTVERLVREKLPGRLVLPAIPAVILVFHFVCLTWVFFRASDLSTALEVLAALGNWGQPVQALTPFLAVLIAGSLVAQHLPADLLDRLSARLARVPDLALGAATGIAIVAIDAFGPEGVAPFIYFQF